MDAFVQPLYELADFDAIIRQLKKPGIVQVSGCLDSQKAHFTNGLLREFPFRLIVAENDLKAKAFYEDFRLYDPEVLYYPARDLIFYQADVSSLKYATFGIGLFALAAVFVSFRILRNFKKFIRK